MDGNDKVAIFGAKKDSNRKLPMWEGFEYYKTIKDVNGISYDYDRLVKFSRKNRYVITVLRQVEKKVCLYNYLVPNEDLKKFFQCCFDGKIEGEIIEIEKRGPENLA